MSAITLIFCALSDIIMIFFALEFKQHSVLNKFGKHNSYISHDLEQSAHTIHVPRDILQLKILEIV